MVGMAQQARPSAQPQVPQEAYQYASMYYLGQPLAAYRVAYRQSIALGIICLLLTGLFGAVVISSETSGTSILFMLLLMLLCVVGVLYYLALYPLRYGSWRIYGCTDGFVFLKGNTAIPYRWDQIAFVWQRIVRYYRNGIYTGTSYKYTVQRADGTQVVMTQMFRDVGQLGERLQREVSNRLAPQALEAVQAGRTLPFGPFNLNQQGLATSRGVLPWSEMQQVTAKSGLVMIQRRGQRRAASYGGVDKVPNLFVFLTVADVLVKGQGR
jgi:hypothetical protein